VKLADGTLVSWMNVADEGTSSHLKAGVQPYSTVNQIPQEQAVQVVNDCFERWGIPRNIKIDNGYPLVNPNHMDIPTMAKLWWIGLGINVIQNDPGKPQQNGTVEGLQRIMGSWSNPEGQPSIDALQERLDQESRFQRESYRIPSKDNKTRAELYPELYENKKNRPFKVSSFSIKRVYDFLSNQVWERSVQNNGLVKFRREYIYVGAQYAKEQVTITLDPVEVQWMIRKLDGTILKTSKKAIPTKDEIVEFAKPRRLKNTT
jgi:hypothetical protein